MPGRLFLPTPTPRGPLMLPEVLPYSPAPSLGTGNIIFFTGEVLANPEAGDRQMCVLCLGCSMFPGRQGTRYPLDSTVHRTDKSRPRAACQ